ncbi:hypothetical protein QL285_092315 [Trifolium repens]|nr:hypothetical protein QL285_092315 [Trifolium repens]
MENLVKVKVKKVMARLRRRRKKVLGNFSKSTINKPPYYAITLANSWPSDQKTKCQDKTLAIGSNQTKPT